MKHGIFLGTNIITSHKTPQNMVNYIVQGTSAAEQIFIGKTKNIHVKYMEDYGLSDTDIDGNNKLKKVRTKITGKVFTTKPDLFLGNKDLCQPNMHNIIVTKYAYKDLHSHGVSSLNLQPFESLSIIYLGSILNSLKNTPGFLKNYEEYLKKVISGISFHEYAHLTPFFINGHCEKEECIMYDGYNLFLIKSNTLCKDCRKKLEKLKNKNSSATIIDEAYYARAKKQSEFYEKMSKRFPKHSDIHKNMLDKYCIELFEYLTQFEK